MSLLLTGCTANGSTKNGSASLSSKDGEDSDANSSSSFSPAVSLLDAIPTKLSTFSLTSSNAPSLSDDELRGIQSALDAVEDTAEAAFVMYDMDSGFGIGYNVDTAIYGASSFKAPYALYLCEDLEENELVELTENDRNLIEAAILYSDNDAYVALRDAYDSVDFDAWVTALGADDAVYRSDSHYPWYCARSSAKLWTEMYLYLQTGSEDAAWLEDLLGNTETSFFRLSLGDTGATFRSKAGWCAGSSDIYNSICEAGLVELDGRTYLLSVMTSLPYGDAQVNLFYDVVEAVFATRDFLA